MAKRAHDVRIRRPQIVEVDWLDACDRTFVGPIAEALVRAKLAHRFQTGYLLRADDELVVLAQTFDPAQDDQDEAEVESLTIIPAGWVKTLRYRRGSRAKPSADSSAAARKGKGAKTTGAGISGPAVPGSSLGETGEGDGRSVSGSEGKGADSSTDGERHNLA